MNRTYLECAVERLAAAHGYTFFAVPDDRIATTVDLYPAAVLAPLTLHSAEGRRHGRMTYDMTLRLLCPGAKLTPKNQRTELAQLETHLLGLFADLSEDEKVIAIEQLQVEAATATFTPHGELSQTATARIITWF